MGSWLHLEQFSVKMFPLLEVLGHSFNFGIS